MKKVIVLLSFTEAIKAIAESSLTQEDFDNSVIIYCFSAGRKWVMDDPIDAIVQRHHATSLEIKAGPSADLAYTTQLLQIDAIHWIRKQIPKAEADGRVIWRRNHLREENSAGAIAKINELFARFGFEPLHKANEEFLLNSNRALELAMKKHNLGRTDELRTIPSMFNR